MLRAIQELSHFNSLNNSPGTIISSRLQMKHRVKERLRNCTVVWKHFKRVELCYRNLAAMCKMDCIEKRPRMVIIRESLGNACDLVYGDSKLLWSWGRVSGGENRPCIHAGLYTPGKRVLQRLLMGETWLICLGRYHISLNLRGSHQWGFGPRIHRGYQNLSMLKSLI